SVCVWDRRSGTRLNEFTVSSFASCVAFSPDGNLLAAGSGEQSRAYRAGSLNVWDLRTAEPVAPFDSMPLSTWAVSFSQDGKRLAAATGYYGSWESGSVRVWDTTTARDMYHLKGHSNCVWSVAFSPDGRRLASAGGSYGGTRQAGEVKIWD